MDFRLIHLFVALSLIACAFSADALGQILSQTWSGMDTNKDGILTVAELQTSFSANYDKNKDGSVSQAEFLAGWGNQQTAAGISIFKQVDSNNDGVWNQADYANLIKTMDTNADGKVTQPEFVAMAAGAFKVANFDPSGAQVVG